MPAARKEWPVVRLRKPPVKLWSMVARTKSKKITAAMATPKSRRSGSCHFQPVIVRTGVIDSVRTNKIHPAVPSTSLALPLTCAMALGLPWMAATSSGPIITKGTRMRLRSAHKAATAAGRDRLSAPCICSHAGCSGASSRSGPPAAGWATDRITTKSIGTARLVL